MDKKRIFLIIVSIIAAGLLGLYLDIPYRTITRNTILYFADYNLDFYPGKVFRFFPLDSAILSIFLPVGYYIVIWKIRSFTQQAILALFYSIFLILSYLLFCKLESIYIYKTAPFGALREGVLSYHINNVNYRLIFLGATALSFVGILAVQRKFLYKLDKTTHPS